MRDKYHPEKRPGEIFLCCVETKEFLESRYRIRDFNERSGINRRERGINAIVWKTRRAGNQAFNIFGVLTRGLEPVFVQRSEIEASGGIVKLSPEELLAKFDDETIAEAARRLFEDEEFKPAVAHLLCDTYMNEIERLMAEGNYVQLARAAMQTSGGGTVFDSEDRVMDAWLKAAEEIAARPRLGR